MANPNIASTPKEEVIIPESIEIKYSNKPGATR
jgi:hypothetical protein